MRSLLVLSGLAFLVLSEGKGHRPHYKQRRHKREWVIAPKTLTENEDHRDLPFVAKIRSDRDDGLPVYYYLKGPGADQNPVNLFMVTNDGMVRITGILDREVQAEYNMTGYAAFKKNDSLAEAPIAVTIKVLDKNDNAPVFEPLQPVNIYEDSPVGSFVTQIHATDRDEPGTPHTSIAYSVVKQEPDDGGIHFHADKTSGKIYVKSELDRETVSSYVLTVQATDMGGEPGGLSGTATIRVHILDVNDNVPTLEKDEFSVSIDENVEGVEVMLIKSFDDDLVASDNWNAEFYIVSGNEDDYFSIHTNPRTNEGVLMLNKPVDFEEEEVVEEEEEEEEVVEEVVEEVEEEEVVEEVVVEQEVEEVVVQEEGLGAQVEVEGLVAQVEEGGLVAQVEVEGLVAQVEEGGLVAQVEEEVQEGLVVYLEGLVAQVEEEVQEGLVVYLEGLVVVAEEEEDLEGFQGPLESLEDNCRLGSIFQKGNKKLPSPKIVATFPASDGDTGEQATNVRYAKGYDPGNWFSIDEETAEVILIKTPDRESPHVVNGVYIAKILCLTNEMPTQTATGTIEVHVEDVNDNCPRLKSNVQFLCSDTKVVNVTAEDLDGHPYGPPLTFTLLDKGVGVQWRLERTGNDSISLWGEDGIWPGYYDVKFEIRDQQGLACPKTQVLHLEVCTCEGGVTSCNPRIKQEQLGGASIRKSSQLGGAAMGALLFGVLTLLLIPLLALYCTCAGATGFTELPFDAKTHLISYHTEGKGEDREVPLASIPVQISKDVSVFRNMPTVTSSPVQMQESVYNHYDQQDIVDMDYSAHGEVLSYLQEMREMREEDQLTFTALPDSLLDNYFSQKAEFTAVGSYQKDTLLEYCYEGHGSPTGSVGSCSLLGADDDLQFLDDLGSKFTYLAEICGYSRETSPKVTQEITPPTTEVDNSVTMATNVKQQRSISFVEKHIPPPLPSMHLRETVAVPTQTVLVQQQQPLYYMVEPQQVQSTVLLAERPQVGLGRGMILVNGSQTATEGTLLQGGGLVQGAQGLVMAQGGQGLVLQQGLFLVNGGQADTVGLVHQGDGLVQTWVSGHVSDGRKTI
ncbi:hypothetical protein AALO_G00121910 [Alosa alosa]|uniref:Cadherin domain-containing protein n=1 Tax=Alosa alosa TaxID=278164 RepID=A0AAV6GL69_9TELE|nr:hypothetical protein AALO_G00121910 [Alosa alosa]